MMDSFVAYNLKFTCEVITPITFTRNKGSVLRGAFYGALRHNFCLNKNLISCRDCPTAELCPICQLVATVDRSSTRGDEVPRPFALEPVLSDKFTYEPGESFSFGIVLFGKALSLFPYAILAIQHMGEAGIGRSRGLFRLANVSVVNPLTGAQESIYSSESKMVHVPDLPITQENVLHYSVEMKRGLSLSINLLTPMRLVDKGALLHRLSFPVFIQRLMERLIQLCQRYCSADASVLDPALFEEAKSVKVAQDKTFWLDLSSYSHRRSTSTPMGGLIGDITFEGPVTPFLPFLVWGQFTHMGKDVTKGNGWYQIVKSSS